MAPSRAVPAAPNLPEPQGTPLEVSFRRLLDCCFKHLQTIDGSGGSSGGGADGPGGTGGAEGSVVGADGDTASMVLKMRHYVDTLREQLADLRAQQEPLGLDAATLDLYDTHVKAVAGAVPKVQLPPYCQSLITGSAVAASSSRPAPNMSYFTPPPARPSVTSAAAGGSARAVTSGRGAEVAGLSTGVSGRLREAEAAQALLTDELAGLTAALKANAIGMAGAVADRGKLLDATDAALTDSLTATKRNVATAGEQVKRSGGNLCFTCMVLLLVGLMFTAMVVYIKFTHIVGYRATHAAGGLAWLGGGAGGAGVGAGEWRDAYGSGDDGRLGAQGQQHGDDPWGHGEL